MKLLAGRLPTGFPILAYHSVADDVGRDVETVSPTAFASHAQWLSDHGIRGVSVSELVDHMQGRAGPARVVGLSFDDGYKDNISTAFPILQRHGFAATVYVATAYIGGESRWNATDYIGHRPMLSAEEIRTLCVGGIEIGSHSHTHADLTRLDQRESDRELEQSRDALGEIVGRPVRGLAAPFGRANTALAQRAAQAGYQHLVIGGRFLANAATSDPFALRRITIGREDSLREFARKVSGAYQWLSFWDRTS
jgi:peptidoglycan/xylan/chitin deacetylase (PgdA/CDA1 family)